jgi:hypothetical protein
LFDFRFSYGALVTSSPKAQLIVSWKRQAKETCGRGLASAVQVIWDF